jgi:hypothetical protein
VGLTMKAGVPLASRPVPCGDPADGAVGELLWGDGFDFGVDVRNGGGMQAAGVGADSGGGSGESKAGSGGWRFLGSWLRFGSGNLFWSHFGLLGGRGVERGRGFKSSTSMVPSVMSSTGTGRGERSPQKRTAAWKPMAAMPHAQRIPGRRS